MDIDARLQTNAYGIRSPIAAEKRYSQTEMEMLACVLGLNAIVR